METATLAGGCFWCTEAIFKRLKGVRSVIPGYTGGIKENPTYQDVCTGTTGHTEAIQIEFDTEKISYQKLLEVFFALHDPTTQNRQGADVGPQYRSAIFYHSEIQKNTAEKMKESLDKSGHYKDKIVTEIVPFIKFYIAENYHQNYFDNNRTAPLGPQSVTRTASYAYCQAVIDPKIKKLFENFKENIKEEAIN